MISFLLCGSQRQCSIRLSRFCKTRFSLLFLFGILRRHGAEFQPQSPALQQGGKGCVVGANPGQANLTVKKDGGDIDAISGSTITSRAFLRVVAEAYKSFQNINK